MTRPIHVFSPHLFHGSGPTETCYRICSVWPGLGQPVRVHTSIALRDDPAGILAAAVPGALPLPLRRKLAGVKRWRRPLHARAAARGLAAIREGDLCYFWPGSDPETIAAARARGGRVVLEFVNTHVAYAKRILDAECARIGAPPYRRLDARALATEARRLALADAAFAPGPFVAPSIRDSTAEPPAILETSYGAPVPAAAPPDRRGRGRPVFVFVGSVGVRKGVHTLLEAWTQAAPDAELWLAGRAEPWIAERYLSPPPEGVRRLGYVADIDALYRRADVFVFPSLEEGGPQVTYEAAGHGLPLLVTPMGAGRIAKDGENALVVPPADAAALAAAIDRLAGDAGLRQALGQAARRAAPAYDWSEVGRQRLEALRGLAATTGG